MRRCLTLSAFILIVASVHVGADVIHVPGDQPTIQAGIDAAVDGDIVLVAPGTYTENIVIDKAIILRSEEGPHLTMVDANQAGSGIVTVNLTGSPCIINGFTINNGIGTDVGWGFVGGGIFCDISSSTEIMNCIIANNSAGWGGAVFCRLSATTTIINSLIYYNDALYGGGIFYQNPYTVIKSSTIVENTANSGGGVYSQFDAAILVNCIIWNNSPDSLYGNQTVTYCDIQGGHAGTGNINADPLFVSGAVGSYYLSQIASGQGVNSPCLNAGSDLAENICFDTALGAICFDQLTTRTDHQPDANVIDIGYHYGDPEYFSPISAELQCDPSTGTLPFQTRMTVLLTNNYEEWNRRVAAHIDITLANGSFFAYWRAGFTNLLPGESYSKSWWQTIRAYLTFVGDNRFDLAAMDVTPYPYNQPPYPPAGDTDTSVCTVTGLSP